MLISKVPFFTLVPNKSSCNKMTIEEVTTETMLQCKDMESEKLNCGDSLKKTFIASPVSDDTCKKVKLQDAEALNHHNERGHNPETPL